MAYGWQDARESFVPVDPAVHSYGWQAHASEPYGLTHRRSTYGWSKRRIGYAGLGFTYNDLLAEAGREDCDPKDSQCVARNQERQIAVEDLWINQYMTHPETANLPTPPINLNLDTSQAAYNAFMANQPLTGESISVGSGPAYSVAQMERQSSPAPVPTPVPVSAPVPISAPATTPAGKTVISSSGPTLSMPGAVTQAFQSGGALSSIPWWGWLAGAGVAVFALRGSR